MKKISWVKTLIGCLCLGACSNYEPYGTWVAKKDTEVYEAPDDMMTIKFIVRVGTHCSLSKDINIAKVFGYNKIKCPSGEGWMAADTSNFEKIE